MIPDYFTYFFREGQTRFQSIYELDDAVIDRIVNGETWREDDTYIAFRRQLEQQMRKQFIAKGGKPQRHYPIYMILGDSPSSPHDLHKNYAHKLVIPRTIFSDDDVSFTYPDSVFHLPPEDLGRIYLERNSRPEVYRMENLETLIDTYNVYDYNNHYIEVQVWNDTPLKRAGYSPASTKEYLAQSHNTYSMEGCMEIPLLEHEIQVLIALAELSLPVETPHNTHYTCYPKTLTEAASYFHHNLLPWELAYHTLLEKRLIVAQRGEYGLTPEGVQQANLLRQQRPPIYYWYRTLYHAIPSSPTFARFCEAVYGVNWEQHGFCDRQQIQLLLDTLALQANHTVLDVGCGTGRFTEFLSDQFNVLATGIDYCDAAVQLARERTTTKRHHLTFETQNLDHLSFPPKTFDVIISIDSLGFVADMEHTISELYTVLKPQGKLAIFWFAMTDKPEKGADILEPDGTPVARALSAHDIAYAAHDVSEENWRILQLRHATVLRYQDAFVAEGNQFLFENLLRESEPGMTPFCKDTCHIRRFFYLVEKRKT